MTLRLKYGSDPELEEIAMKILTEDREANCGLSYEERRFWHTEFQEDLRKHRMVLTPQPDPYLYNGLARRAYNPTARTPKVISKMRNNGTDREASNLPYTFFHKGRSIWEDTDLFEWTQRDA